MQIMNLFDNIHRGLHRFCDKWIQPYASHTSKKEVMSDFNQFLARCQQMKVLIIGDLMIDQYIWGKIDRISPEAPVPVVDIERRELRLGGAANAALNIQAMGARPLLCGITGADRYGHDLIELAEGHDFDTRLIFQLPTRRTSLKTRILSQGQQVLRIDEEDRFHPESQETSKVMNSLFDHIREVDAVIFSDYDKGMLDETFIQMVTIHCNQHEVPVFVDPKYDNFFYYEGSHLFKPNLKELNEALGLRLEKHELSELGNAVMQLRERMPHEMTLVTLGDYGMLAVNAVGQAQHFSAHKRSILDVSGAGDTVMAVSALGMVAGLELETVAHYANLAGGLVCEEPGVVSIDPQRLRQAVQQSRVEG